MRSWEKLRQLSSFVYALRWHDGCILQESWTDSTQLPPYTAVPVLRANCTELNPLLHQKQWGRDSPSTKEGDRRNAYLSHTVPWLHPSPSEPVPSLLLSLLSFVFCFVSVLGTKTKALQILESALPRSLVLHPSLGESKQAPCSFKKVIKSNRSSPSHKTIKNAWVSSTEDMLFVIITKRLIPSGKKKEKATVSFLTFSV